jgi:hypothetical protein
MPTLTQARIRVESPFPFLELTGFKAIQRENEHAKAVFQGIVAETGLTALRQQLYGKLVRFTDEQDGSVIFAGYVQTAEVREELGVYTLSAYALSGSIELDQVKRNRSYQDVMLLYEDVLRLSLDSIPDADFIMRVKDKPIGIPLVQYDETGWEYAKRMASHFDTSITPDMESGLPRFWVGLRAPPGRVRDFSDCEYKAVIDGQYFDVGGNQLGFTRSQFLCYIVKSFDNHPLGGQASFRGHELFIIRKSCSMEADGLPVYNYTLGQPELLARRKFFNDKLAGRSLLGKVIATQGGTVKLHLNIDESQDIATAYNYRWAPPTGNYMYLMPKLGSEVSLYFSDPGEGSAKAINCVRAESSLSSPGFADTAKKSLTSEHGKIVRLWPNRFGMESTASDGPLRFMFFDDSGVTVETAHAITILGDGAVTLEAPVIDLTSPTQVGVHYTAGQDIDESIGTPTSMTVYQGGIMASAESGLSVNVGHDVRTYDYFDDAPEEGSFDWGGLLSNVVAGLAVVACVVAVAAVTLATAGVAAAVIGPILISGAIAGAGAVAAMGVADYQRGNVSSAEDYMREAFIGTVVGLVTGAIGGGFGGAIKAASGQLLKQLGLYALRGMATSAVGSVLGRLMHTGVPMNADEAKQFFTGIGIDTLSGTVGSVIGFGFDKLLETTKPLTNAILTSLASGATTFGTNVGMQSLNMLIFDEKGFNSGNLDLQSAFNSAIISTASSFAGTMANRAYADRQKQPQNPVDDNEQQRQVGGAEVGDEQPKTSSGSDGDGNESYGNKNLGKTMAKDDFTADILASKPKNSRAPASWYDKGGTISIDENGTWTYTDKAGNSVSYPNGYADFGPYAVHSPEITDMIGDHYYDYEKANTRAGLGPNSDPPVYDIHTAPEGYRWHHGEDKKTMYLVPEPIHTRFTHRGGVSIIKKGD